MRYMMAGVAIEGSVMVTGVIEARLELSAHAMLHEQLA